MDTKDLAAAVESLAQLLGQIEHERRNPRRAADFRRFTPSELAGLTEADEVIRDPIRLACGRAVAMIGKHLHAKGVNLDAAAEQVLARAPKGDRGNWLSTLTSRWSGIADWAS